MAPADVRALYDEWTEEQRRRDYRAAAIACAVAGGHPADYFPSLAVMRPAPPAAEELDAKIDGVMGRFGA